MGWLTSLKKELFELAGVSFSGKSLILLAGGNFLIYKATEEIHGRLEGAEDELHERCGPNPAPCEPIAASSAEVRVPLVLSTTGHLHLLRLALLTTTGGKG